MMTDLGVAASGSGVEAVAARLGLQPMPGLDPAVLSGPFLVAEISDPAGAIAAVVGVVDEGDASEGTLNEVGAALAAELGCTASTVSPVGTGIELSAKITVPTTVTGWADATGVVKVVAVRSNDRRSAQSGPAPAQPDPGGQTLGGFMAAASGAGTSAAASGGLDRLVNVGLEVSVEIGRTRVTLADVLGFDVGSTVELDRAAGAPVDIRVNDTLLAHGEVVLVDDEYAVRITAIVDPNNPQS
jgi:flagellar motor switch protein FliN/FliY